MQVHPDDKIISKIYSFRGMKVMIDRDLADLYGVETRILNQAVRRNLKRFPDDFMFQLNQIEFHNWKSQIVISNKEKMSLRKPPLVFTEQGVAMLSSVLHSETAIMVNIQIIRIFTKIRRRLEMDQGVLRRLDDLERKGLEWDKKILLIFDYLKKINETQKKEIEHQNRRIIGFKTSRNE